MGGHIERLRTLGLTLLYFTALSVSSSVLGQGVGQTKELFGDPNFERGFRVEDNQDDPAFLGVLRLPFSGQTPSEEKPVWSMATHLSKYNIVKGKYEIGENVSTSTTPGQVVSLSKDEHGVVTLKLGVRTENEYDGPRKNGQFWIHLLLIRDFEGVERVAFKDVNSLVFSCDARVSNVAKTGPDEEYDPTLHTTQASVYFAIANNNPESPDYRDYIWFGVSFYDERYEVQTDYVRVDGDPQTIGTGKLIYRLGEQRTIDDLMGGVNPNTQKWVHIEIDLNKYLPDAIKAAHEQGFLLNSEVEDFVVVHFNFGWETPGTYRSDLEMKNLRLTATFKEETSPAQR